MVTPQLAPLCPNCHTTSEAHLEQLMSGTRPLYAVLPGLQAWFHYGDHEATQRGRHKNRYLLAAVELLEARVILAEPEPWSSKEAKNQLAALELIREGWQS